MLKTRIRKWCLLLLLLGCCMGVQAQYSMGNTGLLNIPTADMQKAGTFMGGGNYLPNGMTPFNFNTGNYFVNITFLSFLELSYRCTLLKTTRYDGKKGYFQQDRSLSARIRPIEEGKYHPRIGVQRDFIFRSLSEAEKNAFNKLYDQYYLHRGLLTYRRKVEAIISLLRTLGYRFVTFDELAERMENKSERK